MPRGLWPRTSSSAAACLRLVLSSLLAAANVFFFSVFFLVNPGVPVNLCTINDFNRDTDVSKNSTVLFSGTVPDADGSAVHGRQKNGIML